MRNAQVIMDVFQSSPVDIIVVNASSFIIKLLIHQRISAKSQTPSKVLHAESNEYSPYLPPGNVVDPANVVHYNPTPDQHQGKKDKNCPTD